VDLERLRAAREVAAEAGEEALRAFASGGGEVRRKSGPHDLVTEADEVIERLIATRLLERFPQDGILGEEGTGDRPGDSGFTWAIDPVDGTWNFAGGIPHWCVVIACADAGGPLVGVINDVPRGESWSAARGGEGLMLNGAVAPPRAERAADQTTWAAALGRAFAEPRWMRLRGRIGPVRITGSLGLDLAWTAAGRVGALAYTCSLNPWDVWAGELMAHEQGLEVIEEPERRLLMVMPRGWPQELGIDKP
jgi:myo-inositol-1(or 4)-monophosphatase